MNRFHRLAPLFTAATLVLAACGGGGGLPSGGCDGHCADTPTSLSAADVQQIIAQAVAEAQARGQPATIAVVDRVGNVLAVFRMNGAATSITITSGRGVQGGLEGITIIPDTLAAIAKAITGAYLSSEGNAFSTRTASQIVQEHFDPGELGQPAGPLFGVQFSQLPCSDLSERYNGNAPSAGPQRSPLGLSADPGGFPLYKNGTPVGGVGVMADGIYGLDLNINDRDLNPDELIALAATRGFDAPEDRRADHITAGGKSLRYSDAQISDLRTSPSQAPAFASINGSAGTEVVVTGYAAQTQPVAGTAFGQSASGIVPAGDSDFAARDAFFLVDAAHQNNRYAPQNASDDDLLQGKQLTAAEVRQILLSALDIANQTRAQIRQPLNSQARVTISVVDTYGTPLGIARTRDAPVFGTDVSLQKARTAAFTSNPAAASDLQNAPPAQYLDAAGTGFVAQSPLGDYVTNLRSFLNLPTALADGAYAFTDRAGGNMSRPFFPDGIDGTNNGPFSKPYASWSPFSDGLQLDIVYNSLIQHVVYTLGGGGDVQPGFCPGFPVVAKTGKPRAGNGIQIFPGSVPIYRGNTLIGGLGVSGDGVDQDDMISFLGLYNAGIALNGALGNAPAPMRADRLAPQNVNLRYVECPQAPFLNSTEQNPCDGK
jgi:uncharacterized protein GlcG (DUF336 family)